jgi:hypothetical protein
MRPTHVGPLGRLVEATPGTRLKYPAAEGGVPTPDPDVVDGRAVPVAVWHIVRLERAKRPTRTWDETRIARIGLLGNGQLAPERATVPIDTRASLLNLLPKEP